MENTWHFSADIKTCKSPGGGGGRCGWWNKCGGIELPLSKWPGGLPTEGGGNVSTFRGWCGGTKRLLWVNWKVPEVGVILLEEPSGKGNWSGWLPMLEPDWWCEELVLPGICCSFGFLGPRSCWTAAKETIALSSVLQTADFSKFFAFNSLLVRKTTLFLCSLLERLF